MMIKQCSSCLFLDVCDEKKRNCSFYSPITDPLDNNIDYLIETRRNKYYDELFQYIGEYEDDLFF